MKRFAAMLLSLMLLLTLLVGCSGDKAATGSAPDPSSPSSTAKATTIPTTAPTQTPVETPAPTKSGEGLDCDWVMNVDKTITKKTAEGFSINYTFVLNAEKVGGKTEQGTYTGTAHLKVSFDASQMSQDVIKVLGGFNVDLDCATLAFDVIPYNVSDFADFDAPKDLPGLAPLVQYDSMALVNAPFSGTGSLDAFVQGIQGETGQVNKAASGSAPIPLKIAIDGGQVSVTISSLNLGESFDGMVVGTPK